MKFIYYGKEYICGISNFFKNVHLKLCIIKDKSDFIKNNEITEIKQIYYLSIIILKMDKSICFNCDCSIKCYIKLLKVSIIHFSI